MGHEQDPARDPIPLAVLRRSVEAVRGGANPLVEMRSPGRAPIPLRVLRQSTETLSGRAPSARARSSRVPGSQVSDSTFEFLEQLRRPGSAIMAGMISSLEHNKTMILDPAFYQGAFQEFMNFEDRPSFADVLNAGGTPNFPGRIFVEFAGDLIIDPLWFWPAGVVMKGGKFVASVAGRVGAHGILAIERMGLPGASKGLQDMANALTKGFGGAISKAGREAIEVDTQAARHMKAIQPEIAKVKSEFGRDMAQIAAETGEDVGDVIKAVLGGIESRGVSFVDELPFERAVAYEAGAAVSRGEDFLTLKDMVKNIISSGPFDPLVGLSHLSQRARGLIDTLVDAHAKTFDDIIHREIGAKVKTRMMESERIDYITHILTNEAKNILLKSRKYSSLGKHWNPQHTSMLMRELKGVSISEVNAISMAGRLAPLGYQHINMFIDNPAAIEAIRLYRSAKAIASVQVFEELAKNGRKIPLKFESRATTAAGKAKGAEIKKGIIAAQKAARADGYVPLKVPGFKNMWLKEDVVDVINKHFRMSGDDDLLAMAGQTYMEAQSAWKRGTLAVFPEYHARNAVSNVWNNFLAGMGPSQAHWYAAAAAIQSVMKHSEYRPEVVARLIGEGVEKNQAVAKVLDLSPGGLAATVGKGGVMNLPTRSLQAVALPGKVAGFSARQVRNVVNRVTGKPLEAASAASGPVVKAVGKDIALDSTLSLGKWRGTVRELIDLVTDYGVSQGGLFGSEMLTQSRAGGNIGRRFLGQGKKILGREITGQPTLPVRLGFQVGKNIEGNARMAHFMWRLSKGDDAAAASRSVTKYLIDYDAVDPVTKVLRSVPFPFAAWTRYNVPLQLEHLVTDPAKNSIINKARISIERAAGTNEAPDDRHISEYIRSSMGIRTRRVSSTEYQVMLLNNWLPIGSLSDAGMFELLDQGVKEFGKKFGHNFTSLLTPAITLPIEQLAGRSLFTSRPFLPDRKEFLGINMTDRWSSVLRTVRLLSVMDRFIGLPRGQDYGQQVIRTLTGISTSAVSTTIGRRAFVGKVRAEIQAQRGSLRRAQRRGDEAEVERIRKLIRKIQEESRQRRYNR